MLEPELSATLRTWTRLLRAHVATAHVLGGQLQGRHGLSINDYETLSVLSRAPGRRMKRVDLARRLLLTPSGVTRLLDGLQDAGHVERTGSDTDLRVAYARLTDTGAAKLAAAAGTYVDAIRGMLDDHFSARELAQLGDLLAKLPGVCDQHDTIAVEAA